MWIKSRFFKYSLGLVLVLLIIFLIGQIDFFLEPFRRFLVIIFIPLLVSGFLYYLFRPLVRLFKKLKLPPSLAILVVYLIFFSAFSLLGKYAGSIISKQFVLLLHDLPQITLTIRDKAVELMNNEGLVGFFTGKVEEQLTAYAQNAFPIISGGLLGTVTAITSTASVLIVVPFMLFYLLKDDRIFYQKIVGVISPRYRNEVAEILQETDKTLSTYIIGQAIIASMLGILTYIGYLIIGLKYSTILAFFVLITSFIPLFGAIIGVIPAFFVGLAANPVMGVKVLVIMVIVQQIEGNLISPNVIGKRLNIHPLTIILIFLGAASLYGITGMLIAVPAFAVLKVAASGLIRIYKIWSATEKQEN